MFQGLSQGATVSVLYRNTPKVVDGKVISVNTHMPTYNPQQPMSILNGPVTDISVQVGNDTIPFAGLPANGVVANFPEKGLFISTDRSAIVREVEAMSTASKQILESIPAHQKMVSECEKLLMELNPDKKKEVEQARELADLKAQVSELNRLLLASLEHKTKEE